MNAGLLLLLNLITSLAKLVRPGGYRALIAENLILKHQLIIHNRSLSLLFIHPMSAEAVLGSQSGVFAM